MKSKSLIDIAGQLVEKSHALVMGNKKAVKRFKKNELDYLTLAAQ
jgi:hypothetical protein